MTIWLDVTTTLGWRRPALGVVRVEAETARYFLNASVPGISFCRFDRAHGGYFEVGREEIGSALTRLDAGEAIVTPPQAVAPIVESAQISISGDSREERLKRRLLSIAHRLPHKAREAVLRFAQSRREVFFSGVRAYREMKTAYRALINPNISSNFTAPVVPYLAPRPDTQAPIFKAGDVYVSMGLDWDQKDLEYLYQLKQDIGFRVVLFCYDIIPVKLPHLCVGDVASRFARYFTDVAWCADKILCISNCSRRDVSQFLQEAGAPVPELSLVRLGSEVPRVPGQPPSANIADLLQRRYVLFVSTIERRKNHETLYRAYTRLIDAGVTDIPLLVFVGMPGWGVNDLLSDLRLDPRIQPLIRMLNHVSDGDLAQLYQHAEFAVFPSLYEGWGLPVAESLAYGKFCLASNAASIPEVGGDLIEYLDPWDVPAWAARIQWYIEHPDDLSAKEQRIRNEYTPTTWISCAATILETAIERVDG